MIKTKEEYLTEAKEKVGNQYIPTNKFGFLVYILPIPIITIVLLFQVAHIEHNVQERLADIRTLFMLLIGGSIYLSINSWRVYKKLQESWRIMNEMAILSYAIESIKSDIATLETNNGSSEDIENLHSILLALTEQWGFFKSLQKN